MNQVQFPSQSPLQSAGNIYHCLLSAVFQPAPPVLLSACSAFRELQPCYSLEEFIAEGQTPIQPPQTTADTGLILVIFCSLV